MTTTKPDDLLPCPWCGEAVDISVEFDALVSRHELRCGNCGTFSPACETRQQAVDMWNTRHFGRTLTNEIGASAEESTTEAGQTVIDNEASSIKRASENPG